MASRRIAQSNINWSALAERVPPNQKPSFSAFKTKSDVYMRAVLSNPETPPKIDWESYRKLVPIQGLVDNFQKHYDAVKVPYPVDSATGLVEEQIKETKHEIEKFKCLSEERICEYQNSIAHLKSLLPYEQMTLEDYRDSFPDQALDSINRPTFWPHNSEEQIDYMPKDQQAGSHH